MPTQIIKKCLLTISFILLLAANNWAASDYSVHPYTIETPDKKFVFVMLKGGTREETYLYQSDKYPQSGMYLNDSSSTPLWTVDWSAYVYLPSDGIHVIRQGPWPRQSDGFGAEAITFFANGKPLKSYRVRDLVDFPWALRSYEGHYLWQQKISDGGLLKPEYKLLGGDAGGANSRGVFGAIIDHKLETLRVETLTGETYLFDIKTGEIVSSERPMRRDVLITLALCLPLLLYLQSALTKQNERLQTHLKRIPLFALLLTVLLAVVGGLSLVVSIADSLFAGGAYDADVQGAEIIVETLIKLPVLLVLSIGEWTRNITKIAYLFLIPLFWFLVFVAISLINFILVKSVRLAKRKLLNTSEPVPNS